MKNNIEDAERFLQRALHVPVDLKPWRGAQGVPGYLGGRYLFFEGAVGDVRILFVQADEEVTPRTAIKDVRALQRQWTGPVAFVLHAISARNRQRLVTEGVAFVVPQSQIYLPMLGTSLTERFKERALTTERLRPSAQLLLLHTLTTRGSVASTPSAAARLLDYTAMAMGQALDQLEAADLVRVSKVGRERLFELAGDPDEIWERAQPVLASPVKRRRYIAGALPCSDTMPFAGLTALAEFSALSAPRVPVVAASSAQAKQIAAAQQVADLRSPDEADLQIEIWSYTPGLLAGESLTVDRLSLFLSLRDDTDERVRSALEEMMRGVRW